MFDAYTSDGKFAFRFDYLSDLAANWEDLGIDQDVDLNDFGSIDDEALTVLVPSGKGGWHYNKIISADQLQQALTAAGLL